MTTYRNLISRLFSDNHGRVVDRPDWSASVSGVWIGESASTNRLSAGEQMSRFVTGQAVPVDGGMVMLG